MSGDLKLTNPVMENILARRSIRKFTDQPVPRRLVETPGRGAPRRRALLTHFPNVDAIREATMEELLDVPGMNRPAAEAVYAFFHAK